MEKIDIFNEGQPSTITFARFDKVGDGYQGTYIGKREGDDSYGNHQIIYDLLTDEGLVKVAQKDTKIRFHEQMMTKNFGDIIGIKLTAVLPPKDGSKNKNATKILTVFSKSGLVNKDWLSKNQSEVGAVISSFNKAVDMEEADTDEDDDEIKVDGIPFADTPKADSSKTKEEKLLEIANLASSALGVTDPAQIKDKVMEATNLPFIESNLDVIIEKLSTIGK